LFAYPPKLTTESHKESVKMAAAVLSTTARKARKKEAAAKKSAEKGSSKKSAEKAQLAGKSGMVLNGTSCCCH
jgi:26S proteasome regulatory subunit RPN2 C-terminal domain